MLPLAADANSSIRAGFFDELLKGLDRSCGDVLTGNGTFALFSS